jgi:hypothetical protein
MSFMKWFKMKKNVINHKISALINVKIILVNSCFQKGKI